MDLEQEYFSFAAPLQIPMFKEKIFMINFTYPCDVGDKYIIKATSAEENVFQIKGNTHLNFTCVLHHDFETDDVTDSTTEASHVISNGIIKEGIALTIAGKLIGISKLVLVFNKVPDHYSSSSSLLNNSKPMANQSKLNLKSVIDEAANHKSDYVVPSSGYDKTSLTNDVIGEEITSEFQVLVLRSLRPIDKVFMLAIPIFLFVITVGFGCKLDLGIVKECTKKPIAPGIGMGCQYILMPLIGFSIAKLLPNIDDGIALGIFVSGICPGGGVSNIYTYLLDGDVSLSITMTFLSTIASIVFLPLWLYTLGTLFLTEQFNVTVPWPNLIQIIALVTVPLFIGIFLKYKVQKVAILIIKILKPLTLGAIFVLICVAIYANWYVFKLFKPLYILAGCLLPYIGYIFGGLIATLFRQPLPRIKAIALETGMQNTAIAYLLMVSSLPPPHGDLASVAPMASAFMTPIPVFIITIIYTIYKKCCKKYDVLEVDEPEIDVKVNNITDDNDDSGDEVSLAEKFWTIDRETIL
ncbi:hypothetical protein ACF0H5_007004 [Mactra antiquata]